MQNLFRFKNTKLPWWLKICTDLPSCTYYFGPFSSAEEAQSAQTGYLEDLAQEKAQGITVEVEQGIPENLTMTN